MVLEKYKNELEYYASQLHKDLYYYEIRNGQLPDRIFMSHVLANLLLGAYDSWWRAQDNENFFRDIPVTAYCAEDNKFEYYLAVEG